MLIEGALEVATRARPHIVVYPSRGRLLRYALLYVVGIFAFGLFLYWSVIGDYPQTNNPRGDWIFALAASLGVVGRIGIGILSLAMGLLLAVILACTLYRILVRKPSISVDAVGVTDGCSLIAGGVGLIRWDEIQLVMVETHSKRARFLCVMPRDADDFLRQRQHNLLIRLFRRSLTISLPRGINLPEWLFSEPAHDVLRETEWRYQQVLHAHNVAILSGS